MNMSPLLFLESGVNTDAQSYLKIESVIFNVNTKEKQENRIFHPGFKNNSQFVPNNKIDERNNLNSPRSL